MANDEVVESAKAAQEVAKAAGKAIDAGQQLGGFFSRVFGPALVEAGGMLHDQITFTRNKRLVRLEKRFEAICNENGIDPNRVVSLKIGLPLLEAASLEDDDDLQDMYARLLVNAVDDDSHVNVEKVFVSLLSEFSSLDARVFNTLVSVGHASRESIATEMLPEKAEIVGKDGREYKPPSEAVLISLSNLARLGCLEAPGTWGGYSEMRFVAVTPLARALYRACVVKKKTG